MGDTHTTCRFATTAQQQGSGNARQPFVTPNTLLLIAGGGKLTLWDTFPSGALKIAAYSYSTGMHGNTDPTAGGQGPLPPGSYTINPSEISPTTWKRRLDPRDWGDYRAPLHPNPGTNTYGRSGFFLHGGYKRLGSEGCIKVSGCQQIDLFQRLRSASGPITLIMGTP